MRMEERSAVFTTLVPIPRMAPGSQSVLNKYVVSEKPDGRGQQTRERASEETAPSVSSLRPGWGLVHTCSAT